jgi:hypothetical protein
MAVSPAAHREPVEEGYGGEGKEEGGEGVPLHGASANVDGLVGAVEGDVVGGRDTAELFASVDKCGGRTELAHVFEHDAVVGGIEGAFEVRLHDVDVFVVYFGVFHHHDDGGKGVVYVALVSESVLLVA